MRLVLVGHACGPDLGSEPGITWNWATHLASDNEVIVVAPPTNRSLIERALETGSFPNLRFEWVSVPKHLDTWRGGRGFGIRIHYLQWKKLAIERAVELCKQQPIDHVHYISWNTIGSPPNLAAIPGSASWGPVGGGQTPPFRFLHHFGPKAIVEIARAARLKVAGGGPRLRATVAKSRPLLVINGETARILQLAGASDLTPMLEVGVDDVDIAREVGPRQAPGRLVVLWAGRLERHKALNLAIRALSKTTQPVELRIAGDGPLRERTERLVQKLGIGERVSFLGRLPLREMREAYSRSDAFLFTSLRDSSGGVVFEAMAAGLPVVIPDHQGVRTHVPHDASIRFSVRSPRATIVEIAEALDHLASDEYLRRNLALGGLEYARSITWDKKVEAFTNAIGGKR